MAEEMTDSGAVGGTKELRGRWAKRIADAQKDYSAFHTSGTTVVDTYRIEARSAAQKDKYNILYSITETIKPSMYSQTPKAQVKRRHIDRKNPTVLAASLLMESAVQYTVEEQDFDDNIASVVEDFLLPGLGQVWLRYEPTITSVPETDEAGQPLIGEDGKPVLTEQVDYEFVDVDHLFWKDFLTSKGRKWKEIWWVAKRVYFDKAATEKRFGAEIANKCVFELSRGSEAKDNQSIDTQQIAVWEIWDKRARRVIWFSDAYPDGVLAESEDFLKLKEFFPCPRPLRAVITTNKFVPRPFFSQYQAQADELNDITHRIRLLVKALRVVGIYDSSVEKLQSLLNGDGNKMVPVEGWATVQDKGGLKGVVDFLPITEVASTLMQLYDARERVKGEIYEITGWSDIIRGVSRASETLGAQQLKAEWAGARLKLLQKEVQRFVRDIFRIIGEICAEHFSEEMLMLMAGFEPDPNKPEEIAQFRQVHELIKTEKDRCALIGVETDSTLAPDDANDRKERMEFISAAGAFLQQAIPAAQNTPAMGPLLGEILMFAVRSFRSARSLENSFEQFTATLAANPPQQDKKEETGKANPEALVAAKANELQAKVQMTGQELQQEDRHHSDEMSLDQQKEANRHAEQMRLLSIREREVAVKEYELGIKENVAEAEIAADDADRQLADLHQQESRMDAAEDRAEKAQERANRPSGENS